MWILDIFGVIEGYARYSAFDHILTNKKLSEFGVDIASNPETLSWNIIMSPSPV